MHATTVAVDLAKDVFQVATANRAGRIIERKRLTRSQFERFVDALPAGAEVVMEACGTAHYWGRRCHARGHHVRLLPVQYVQPYVRRNKTDRTDTDALLEAARCEGIQPVPVKTPEQQALQVLHRVRTQWQETRTARLNTLRGMLREHGMPIALGARTVLRKVPLVLEDADNSLPEHVRYALALVYEEVQVLEHRVKDLDRQLARVAAADPVAQRLLQMLTHRQGFGDVLAEGVKIAAERLGGKAKESAIYTMQGASPRGHDHRGRWDEMLDTCTGSTGTLESGVPVHVAELGLPTRINPFNGVEVATQVAGIRGRRHFEDSLGICIFTARTRMENLCRALSAATGWYYTVDEGMRTGRRTAAVFRAIRLRCGIGIDRERPSIRYGSTPHDGPAKGQAVSEQWEQMVDTWYEKVGYDRKTGKPRPQTLKDLGLDWLARDLWGKKA